MRAVRNGESPQKTEVLAGAFIPKASVPIIVHKEVNDIS